MSWRRLVLRNLRQRPGRTAASIAAVAIGVTVFLSVSIGTRSLADAIDVGDQNVLAHTVQLVPVGVFHAVAPAATVEPLRLLPDVLFAQGSYSQRATVEQGTGTKPDGTVVPEWVISVNLTAVKLLPPMSGRPPAPGAAEIAVSRQVTVEINAKIGSKVQVRTPSGLHDAVITGVIDPGGDQSLYALTSPQTMQAWDSVGDVVDNVTLVLADHADPDAWVAAHRDELGGFEPASGVFTSDALKFFHAIDDTLAPLSSATLFVAGYLIFLTMGRAVQDRSTTSATLRALGTSRSQLVRLLLGEATVLGIVGTAIGFGCGSVLGRGVTAMLRGMFNLRVASDVSSPVSGSVIAVALVLGLATPIVATLLPALRASRADPAAHLRGEVVAEQPVSWTRLIIGTAVFVVGAGATTAVGPRLTGLATVVALIGAVIALPVASRPIGAAVARVWSRLRPGPGELAAQEMARRPGRSAQTTALLACTLVATFILATLNASQRPEFINILAQHYGATADVYGGNGNGDITNEQLAALRSDPAVAAVSAGARGAVTILNPGGRSEPLSVIDPDSYFSVAGLPWAPGTNSDAAIAALRAGDVLVATAIADRISVGVGDQVSMRTARGPASFRVAGIFHGLGWGETVSVVVSTKVATESFGLRAPSLAHVDLRPGTDIAAWSDKQWSRGLYADPTSRVRANILGQFDGITNIAVVLLVITVLVGVLGLANTLAMDVYDRRREIGVLRALGTHRREVRSIVLSQALMFTAVAGVLAVLLGTVLGAASVAGSGNQVLALPMSFRFPYRAVPLILGSALVVGALAAITPARAAARMEPTDAVRLPAEA